MLSIFTYTYLDLKSCILVLCGSTEYFYFKNSIIN